MKKYIFAIGIFFLYLSFVICGCIEINNIEDTKDKFGWSQKEIIKLSEDIIKEKFISPSTTIFYNITIELIKENLNNNEYKVIGKVDSENKFGKKIENSFFIYLECSSEGKYQIGDLDIYV